MLYNLYVYIYMYISLYIFCSKRQATPFNHVYGFWDLLDPGFLCFSYPNKTLMLGHTWYTTWRSIKLCYKPKPMVDFRLSKCQTQCVKTYWTGHGNHVWSFTRYDLYNASVYNRYFVFRVYIYIYICIYIYTANSIYHVNSTLYIHYRAYYIIYT